MFILFQDNFKNLTNQSINSDETLQLMLLQPSSSTNETLVVAGGYLENSIVTFNPVDGWADEGMVRPTDRSWRPYHLVIINQDEE